MTDRDDGGDSTIDRRGPADDRDELEVLLRCLALKDERRTGWQLRGIDDPESVAGHSWSVSLLSLFYADRADVDADRATRMAVLHDLAEAETGDHPTRADPNAETIDRNEKERAEREAIGDLLDPFDAEGDHRAIWEEYEARETPEARFVKDMDLVDMCMQAARYEREGRYDLDSDAEGNDHFEAYDRLDEFFATAEPRIRTAIGRKLFDLARERYEDAKRDR